MKRSWWRSTWTNAPRAGPRWLGRRRCLPRLDGVSWFQAPAALEESRAELRRRLALAGAARAWRERSSFWDKVREGFTIHFHFAPGIAQVAGAAAMLALGFLTARVAPNSFSVTWHRPAWWNPTTSRVRYVEPVAPGRVQIVIWMKRGSACSRAAWTIKRFSGLLLTAAKDPSDAGLRVESVDLLKNNSQSAEIRKALVYSLEHDTNAGVRLKALDGLKQFAEDPDTRQALTQVLLKDDNPGVRTQVIDLLVQRHTDAMVGVLQELMEKEDNGYIRMRCQKSFAGHERVGGDVLRI
jgi:hypothetical protein